MLWIHTYSQGAVREEKDEYFLYDFDSKTMTDLTEYFSPFEDTFLGSSYWGEPVSSPDGRYIAYRASRHLTIYDEDYPDNPMTDWTGVYLTAEIFLLDLETYELTQLTHGNNTWEGYLWWTE